MKDKRKERYIRDRRKAVKEGRTEEKRKEEELSVLPVHYPTPLNLTISQKLSAGRR